MLRHHPLMRKRVHWQFSTFQVVLSQQLKFGQALSSATSCKLLNGSQPRMCSMDQTRFLLRVWGQDRRLKSYQNVTTSGKQLGCCYQGNRATIKTMFQSHNHVQSAILQNFLRARHTHTSQIYEYLSIYVAYMRSTFNGSSTRHCVECGSVVHDLIIYIGTVTQITLYSYHIEWWYS